MSRHDVITNAEGDTRRTLEMLHEPLDTGYNNTDGADDPGFSSSIDAHARLPSSSTQLDPPLPSRHIAVDDHLQHPLPHDSPHIQFRSNPNLVTLKYAAGRNRSHCVPMETIATRAASPTPRARFASSATARRRRRCRESAPRMACMAPGQEHLQEHQGENRDEADAEH